MANNPLSSIGSKLAKTTADLLANSDFINRSVGMANSYEDIMFIVQALGREPISLLGKDYLYIFDHVRRNYNMGSNVMNQYHNDCPKFTFYKEKPTVRFANPYDDPKNLLDRWMPDVSFEKTSQKQVLISYAESDDDKTNNKEISSRYDIENANPGINMGGISSFANVLNTCDIIKKTNDNFNYGKYRTLVARFHTNSMDSKSKEDITQTAISEQYGMSHGRNLLKMTPSVHNGYDNPYCRVWTYHHQYNQLARAIRPFGDADTEEDLESQEQSGDYNTVGFRTVEDKNYGFKGGSVRLDKYGVMNYRNGLVNIAPTAKIKDYFEGKTDKEVTIKKCMFSIENLAWKTENVRMGEFDPLGLSAEQKGPLGGRIMWFPPYDLSFSEDVRVNWNQNQFIGRGEKVYTYTDTERTGNLSFTLLIDHPSILDYWTGHKRNGMKNQGLTLVEGNGGGVDERNNQENTLLRFFAGCEILTAKPQEFRQRVLKPEITPDPPAPAVKDPPETEVHKPTVTQKVIHCVLYYPNNYSGVDDAPTSNSKVNAIYYLMNGVGAQKYVDTKNDAVDIPTQIDSKASVGGGYEIDSTYGVSIVKKALPSNYSIITSTYADTQSKERKAQYLTDESGNKQTIAYGSKSYDLAKLVGSKAMSMSSAKESSNLAPPSYLWYRRRWYYRVDKAYENDRLSHKDSYLDVNSSQLNGKGYEKLRQNKYISKEFGLSDDDTNVTLISFADLFVALEGDKAKVIVGDDNINSGNVETIRNIIEDSERFNVTSIKFEGHASYQGYAASNNALSKNRALTFKKWVESKGFPNIEEASTGMKKASPNNNVDKGDNSELSVKLWRSASMIIEYEESNVENASTAEQTNVADNEGNLRKDRVEIDNNVQSKDAINQKTARKSSNWMEEFFASNAGKEVSRLAWAAEGERLGKDYFDKMSWDYDPSYHNAVGEETNVASIKSGVVERYDNEGEFFELLEKNDPFMHHLITDKIKYFDPAYHSISPEGFNARLTFLHQCTRQGSTVGGADSQLGSTAYNLAFGRPPVCVLRLGDFYYTKIIINSLSIQYETPQWDLNPEGIGVMPMFAKVTLSFVFLGGSDLAGPISRLQNAVSFNYYANTGVYDNRAEMVQYDSDGNGKEVKFKPFSYPDMMHTDGTPPKKKPSNAYEEDLRWLREFHQGITPSNAEVKQTNENILKFDRNFK